MTPTTFHSPRRRARGALAVVVVLAAGAAAACSGAPATAPASRTGVGVRSVDVAVAGAVDYDRTGAPVTGGGISVRYTGQNLVERIWGVATLPGAAGGDASFAVDLTAVGGSFSGNVSITDPSVGVDVVVPHQFVSLAIDGDGDVRGGASAGGVSIRWSVETLDAPGLEPVLDDLSALEGDWCRSAQQLLSGVDPAQVPLASIGSTVHPSRTSFGSSKATLSPLATHTWQEAVEVDTAAGNHVVITGRISCKARSADHLATAGYAVGPEQECRVLNEAARAAADAALTPAERDAYTAAGTPLVLDPDTVRETGIEWLTPMEDLVESGGVARLGAHALYVAWNDPDYVLVPDSIRGVHYCTVRTPAWFYWWFTAGGL